MPIPFFIHTPNPIPPFLDLRSTQKNPLRFLITERILEREISEKIPHLNCSILVTMTEVLHTPSPSSPPSISTPSNPSTLFNQTQSYVVEIEEVEEEVEEEEVREKRDNDRRDQLSLLALLITLFRKSCRMACSSVGGDFSGGGGGVMEISWPSGVQHVNHVTFDRFDGFLGLPLEFEPEVLRRAPSASATVFGVSTESMQLSYDSRGNSIPTILLLMQRHLYSRGGLQAEGIFRITAGNSQEEFVRERLNGGVVPEGTDVHCLAGLIKAWFRELPRGLLDSLTPEQVMQCQSEDECEALVRLLPSTEAALLNWAINLMADVVQNERFNKMNAHNIAMVFAPNMTQMADPLTALMHAVQVMNFLKTLIEKTLREREEIVVGSTSVLDMEPSDDNGNQSSWRLNQQNCGGSNEEMMRDFVLEDPVSDTDNITDEDYHSYSTCTEESDESRSCETSPPQAVYRVVTGSMDRLQNHEFDEKNTKGKTDRLSDFNMKIDINESKERSNLSRINSMTEWFEAWR